MPFIVYSIQRLALFAVASVVLFALHVGGWLLVVLAAVIAWVLSYVLLKRSRDAAALWVYERTSGHTQSRLSRELAADALAEDNEVTGSQSQTEAEQNTERQLDQTGTEQNRLEQSPPGPEHDSRDQDPDRQGEQHHQQ